MGGGFYLAQGTSTYKTTLRFNLTAGQAIGVFANKADCAADDVAAEGYNAEIRNMPAVEDMVLDKLAGAIVTGWDEDYRTNDTCYSEGTFELGRDFKNAERYRTVIARGDDPVVASRLNLDEDSVNMVYMCLTLGYNFPIPEYLWITDHEDLGNGVVNLQFRPCFSNENDKTFSIVQWAKAADEGGNLWVVWGESEQELLANCDDIKEGSNGMRVALREKDPIDDNRRIWVTTPFFTNWTHEASSGTNRFYKIVVDDLRENILKERNQASK